MVAGAAVLALGGEAIGPDAPLLDRIKAGYPLALGIGITAGMIQILLGLLNAGKLGGACPTCAGSRDARGDRDHDRGHQSFPMLGLAAPTASLMDAVAAHPRNNCRTRIESIAAIGLVSLSILVVFPFLKGQVPSCKRSRRNWSC